MSTHLDWLTVTWKGKFTPLLGETDLEDERGLKGYLSGYRSKYALYQKGDEVQGNMCQISATGLDDLRRDTLIKDNELCYQLMGKKCTRLDFAMNIFNSSLSAKGMQELLLSGAIAPRSKSATLISDPFGEKGDTLYLGSIKTRQKFCRCYESSTYRGDNLNRFRIELQLGKEGGSVPAMADIASSLTEEESNAKMLGAIAGFLNHNGSNKDLKEALGDNKTKYKVENSHINDTQKWLLSLVLPVLAREMKSSESFYDEFIRLLNEQIGV